MKFPFLLLGIAAITAPLSAETAITIYNQNFAIVRQDVALDLAAGENSISFDGVTSQLEPDSVVLRDLSGEKEFSILEQNYRNDPVSEALLLEQFVGQSIDFQIPLGTNGFEVRPGKIIRSGFVAGSRNFSQPIIELDGKVRFGLPGTPLFPSLGSDNILKPTLNWLIQSAAPAAFNSQLSYVSQGFRWKADYNLIVPENGDASASSLNGWLTLTNASGTEFKEAKLKLLAGDVNKLTGHNANQPAHYKRKNVRAMAEAVDQVTEKSLDSYHLYTVQRPVDLKNNETKQIEFFNAPQITASKKYVYNPLANQRYYGGRNENEPQKSGYPRDINIYWQLDNKEENGLGLPLPAGKLRLYQQDSDQQLEFLGENTIDHTPKNELIEVYTGNAFDLKGDRTVTNFESRRVARFIKETIELKVSNRSKETATVEIREPLYRWSNWKISNNSAEFRKLNANEVAFDLQLAPDEVKTITFTVKYTW